MIKLHGGHISNSSSFLGTPKLNEKCPHFTKQKHSKENGNIGSTEHTLLTFIRNYCAHGDGEISSRSGGCLLPGWVFFSYPKYKRDLFERHFPRYYLVRAKFHRVASAQNLAKHGNPGIKYDGRSYFIRCSVPFTCFQIIAAQQRVRVDRCLATFFYQARFLTLKQTKLLDSALKWPLPCRWR